MTVAQLLKEAGVRPTEMSGDAEIGSLRSDSRLVEPGAFFVCMPSLNSDTNAYIPEAAGRGASAILAHSEAGFRMAQEAGVCAVHIREGSPFREAAWRLAKAFFGNPSASMQVVGVTGTNGKTTTAWMLRDMCGSMGVRSAYLGTLGFHLRGQEHVLENTTPFAIELNQMLSDAKEAGVWSVAMEVSSHALKERRADGVEFDAGVFTNLTQDHLDYHKTMEDYEASKRRLFEDLPRQSKKPFVAALNADDAVGAQWAERLTCRKLTFGLSAGDLQGAPLEVSLDRIVMRMTFQGRTTETVIPLGGLFNVQNCMSAAGGFLALGHDLETTATALSKVRPVPGRFEAVSNDKGIGVIVDYAHTPDALVKLLESTQALRHGRLITVFGCGGDRDKNKRPKMARAVSENSDVAIVTSDNPRTEDPETILREVAAGLAPGSQSAQIIDRREAIAHAIGIAEPGDIVVIAGKGHENYQIIGRSKVPMDDREMAREALRSRS